MANSYRAGDAIQPLDHQVIEGMAYALELNVGSDKGNCIEVTGDESLTMLTGAPVDNKVECQISTGGAHSIYCVGILAKRKRTTQINRGINVIIHGVTLAWGQSTNAAVLIPGRLWESSALGSITYAATGLRARGKIIEPILPGKYGKVTVF